MCLLTQDFPSPLVVCICRWTLDSSLLGAGGWLCSPHFYNTSDGCDCGCGLLDPDCERPVLSSDLGIGVGPDGECIYADLAEEEMNFYPRVNVSEEFNDTEHATTPEAVLAQLTPFISVAERYTLQAEWDTVHGTAAAGGWFCDFPYTYPATSEVTTDNLRTNCHLG